MAWKKAQLRGESRRAERIVYYKMGTDEDLGSRDNENRIGRNKLSVELVKSSCSQRFKRNQVGYQKVEGNEGRKRCIL